ncbi:hypothetical protein HDV05_004689 [Chytridiales sp. JEL 0842]|nr:hypothetical protein HDV05_004689 [Chytridiales sp. JEL 0842]
MSSTEVKKKEDNPYGGLLLVGAFAVSTVLGVAFGPSGKVLREIWSKRADNTIITDDQLSMSVNFLGCVVFVLIIVHHYLESKKSKKL